MAEVLDSFLIALGYKTDEASQKRAEEGLGRFAEKAKKTEKALAEFTTKFKQASLAITAIGGAIVATVAKVAQSYEHLYYASQRMYASVGSIQALSYSLSQVGGTAKGAAEALESIGSFLRSSPNAEGFFQRLGIQTRGTHGELRDTASILTELGARFRTMPSYQATAYAGVLGIDQNTLQALMRGTGQFSEQLKAMYRAAGLDADKAAAGSAHFMQQLRGLAAVVQVVRDKFILAMERGVGGGLERLRALIEHNLARISEGFSIAGSAIGFAFNTVVPLGTRVIEFFTRLDPLIKYGLVAFAAWRVALLAFNAAFLATPIGRLFMLGTALVSLYDDYRTWKEGGKSLINWAEWEPGIKALIDSVRVIENVFKDMWPTVHGYLSPLLAYLKNGLLAGIRDVASDLSDLSQAIDDLLNKRWKSAGDHMRAIGQRENASNAGLFADAAKVGSAVNTALGNPLEKLGNLAQSAGAMMLLQNMGIDRTHAAALIGSWQQESSLNPRARNGSHVGIEQWSPERADAIKRQFGIDVRTAGFAEQVRAAVLEITQGGEKSRAARFFASTNTAAATGFFTTDIERSGEMPGMAGYDRRMIFAARAENSMRLGGPGSASIAGRGRQSVALNQTINVNGARDPAATAREVHRTTDVSTKALARNMTPLAY